MNRFCLILLPIIFLVGCKIEADVDVDEQKLEELNAQLDVLYIACSNEGIDDPEGLEEIINNNGNGLSKGCRDEIKNIDLQDIVDTFDLKLTVTVTAFEDVLPWQEHPNRWYGVTNFNAGDRSIVLATPNNAIDWSSVVVKGVTADNAKDTLTNIQLENLLGSETSVSYVIDYSASMIENDLIAVGGLLQDTVTVLPASTEASVTYFNEFVTDESNGFITDSTQLSNLLAFDSTYERTFTALLDGVGNAASAIPNDSSVHLNIIVTDGNENSSTQYSKNQIQTLLAKNNTYTVVLASGFANVTYLQTLVGDDGVVLYHYHMDEIATAVDSLDTFVSNAKTLVVNYDLSSYEYLEVLYQNSLVYTVELD